MVVFVHVVGSPVVASEEPIARQQADAASAADQPRTTSGPQDMKGAEAPGSDNDKRESGPGVKPVNEAQLRERVQARWDAAIKGDFAKAYAFETPEFRKSNTQGDYAFRLGRSQVRWHVASLKELRYDRADSTDAIVTLEYSFAISGGDELARTSGDFSERWVFLDGEWWRQEIRRPLGGKTQSKPSLNQ